MYPKYYFT